jgi:hypothetical protein
MSQYDILYRALIDYRKNTRENKDCTLHRNAIIAANNDTDIIKITSNICTIHEDWVEEIERGIVFVEKAINEARQFIRSNGEVVPIEKVKRVSKDTVEHLARHSNLVTREPKEGDDIVPDELFMVERLSDYAVYENRFLYMLLCYLRDFIGMRYEKILELTNTYQGSMSMNKTVVESNRRLVYEVNLVEEKKNDEYLREHNAAQSTLDRILILYEAVNFFLNTPLMSEVAKTPMLKPPITRTNVLRMNQNFRKALALYEYVAAYEGDGYEINTEIKTFSPLSNFVADEIAETVELSSFLTYEHGLEIKEYFKRRYEREEQRRKEEERLRLEEQLKGIRKRLKQENISPEEYIMMLEKRISDLEAEREDLAEAHNKIDELTAKNNKLQNELKYAYKKIALLESEIVELKIKHEEEIARLNAEHAEEIASLKLAHAEEITRLKTEHAEEIDRLNIEHAEEIEYINAEHAREIERINTEHEEIVANLVAEHEREVEELKERHAEEIDRLNTEHAEEIDRLNTEHAEEVRILNENHRAEVDRLNLEHQNELDRLNEKHRIELEEQKNAYEQKMANMQLLHEKAVRALNEAVDSIRKESEEAIKLRDYVIDTERKNHIDAMNKTLGELNLAEKTITELSNQCTYLAEENALSGARLNALRSQYGLIKDDEDFTNKEMADELEFQYVVFNRFRKRQWQHTKERIRQEIFDDVKRQEEEKDRLKREKKEGKQIVKQEVEPEKVEQIAVAEDKESQDVEQK